MLRGICPECEFAFSADAIEPGEALVCAECALTLQVVAIERDELRLEMVEASLPDWGE